MRVMVTRERKPSFPAVSPLTDCHAPVTNPDPVHESHLNSVGHTHTLKVGEQHVGKRGFNGSGKELREGNGVYMIQMHYTHI